MRELAATAVEDDAAFAALESDWWDLWRRAPSATPFQSPAWLLPWWASFRPGALFGTTVRYGERLVGLGPFYTESGRFGRRLLPIGISLSDYCDVLLDPECDSVAACALVDEASRRGAQWDGWDLEELMPGAAAMALPRPAACTEVTARQSACPVLAMQPGDALGGVPSGKLRKLRMARRRGARRNAEIFVPAHERWREFMADLFRLHGARWQARGEPGVLADETVHAFHQRSVPGLLAARLLRLYGIRVDGRIAGAYYGFLDRGRAYAYLAGFDPGYAFESPGTVLVGHAIEEAGREGATEFHFLRGPESYKYAWGATDRWNVRRSFRRQPLGSP